MPLLHQNNKHTTPNEGLPGNPSLDGKNRRGPNVNPVPPPLQIVTSLPSRLPFTMAAKISRSKESRHFPTDLVHQVNMQCWVIKSQAVSVTGNVRLLAYFTSTQLCHVARAGQRVWMLLFRFRHRHSDLELSGPLSPFLTQELEDGRADQNNRARREVSFLAQPFSVPMPSGVRFVVQSF